MEVGGILLAAGESRRMGAVNKLALSIGGEPLLRRTARVLFESKLSDLVIVLGHDADRGEEMVRDLNIRTVRNPNYTEGQMSSVHCGLAALTRDVSGIMICLADQPLLNSEDIDGLIDAFEHRARGSILVPTHRGRRGNPIIVAAEHRDTIQNGERNLGCKRLIERNPDLVETVEMTNDHTVFDVDRPPDYVQLCRRLGRAVPVP